MPDHVTTPVYTLRTCTSEVTQQGKVSQELLQQQISGWAEEIGSGYAVCQLEQKLLVGLLESGCLLFQQGLQPDYMHLLHLRLFNQQKELFVRRDDSGLFRYRQRVDSSEDIPLQAEGAQFVETDLPLWGTTHRPAGSGWTTSSEERGISLTLPLDGLTGSERSLLRIRAYIGYAETGQAGYHDMRYVNLLPGGDS